MMFWYYLQDLGAHAASWNIEPLTGVKEHGIWFWPWW